MLLLGGRALRQPALAAAARIAAAPGARVLTETFPARLERGAGRPAFDRLGYFAEAAEAQLAGVRHLVLAGAASPVAFFAYPGPAQRPGPSRLSVHLLAETGRGRPRSAGSSWLTASPARRRRPVAPAGPTRRSASLPAGGPLSAAAIGAVVGASLPEGAVIVDEAITASLGLAAGTAGAPPHDWLSLTGGAIGQGLPAATGAAVASPGRRTICVEADGSAMYTIQALWTQARESLDVTTIMLSNRAYAILQIEMHRVQADPPGPTAAALLDLDRPTLDLVAVARGLGVPAVSVTTVEELDAPSGAPLPSPARSSSRLSCPAARAPPAKKAPGERRAGRGSTMLCAAVTVY